MDAGAALDELGVDHQLAVQSPAALLAGDDALERDFVLKDAGRSDGLEWVEATPKARDGSFERVRIGFSGELPRVMDLQDSFGQTTTLKFAGLQRIPRELHEAADLEGVARGTASGW